MLKKVVLLMTGLCAVTALGNSSVYAADDVAESDKCQFFTYGEVPLAGGGTRKQRIPQGSMEYGDREGAFCAKNKDVPDCKKGEYGEDGKCVVVPNSIDIPLIGSVISWYWCGCGLVPSQQDPADPVTPVQTQQTKPEPQPTPPATQTQPIGQVILKLQTMMSQSLHNMQASGASEASMALEYIEFTSLIQRIRDAESLGLITSTPVVRGALE